LIGLGRFETEGKNSTTIAFEKFSRKDVEVRY